MHYDLEILPDDRGTLAKYNSDVCKCHLFFSQYYWGCLWTPDRNFCFRLYFVSKLMMLLKWLNQQHSQSQPLLLMKSLKVFLRYAFHPQDVQMFFDFTPPLCHKVLMEKLTLSRRYQQCARCWAEPCSWTSNTCTLNSKSISSIASNLTTLLKKIFSLMWHSSWLWV